MTNATPIPELFRESYSLSRKHFPATWKLFWRRVLVPFMVVAATANYLAPSLYYGTTSDIQRFALAMLSTIVIFAVFALPAYGGLIETGLAAVYDRERRFHKGFGWLLFWVSFLVGLISGIINGILKAVGVPIIPSLIQLYLGVQFYLLTTVLVAEKPGIGSIANTWRLMKGRWFYTASRMLALWIPAIVASFVIAILIELVVGYPASVIFNIRIENIPRLVNLGVFCCYPLLMISCLFEPFYKAILYRDFSKRTENPPATEIAIT